MHVRLRLHVHDLYRTIENFKHCIIACLYVEFYWQLFISGILFIL